jgi:teichuronic acid biosynthesis protein TuaE
MTNAISRVLFSLFSKITLLNVVLVLFLMIPFLGRTESEFFNSLRRNSFILLVLVLFLFWYAERALQNTSFKVFSYQKLLIYFFIFALISSIYSPYAAIALKNIFYAFVCLLFFFMAVYAIQNESSYERLLIGIFFIAGIIILLAFFQIATKTTFFRDIYPRINGVFWDPNIFARYLNIIFALILPYIFFSKKEQKSWLLVFASVLLILIFLTLSRGGILVFLSTIFIYLYVNKRYKLLFYSVLIGMVTTYFLFLLLQDIRFNLSSGGVESFISFYSRISMMQNGFQMFLDNMFLGVGFETFRNDFVNYINVGLLVEDGAYSIHNWPIQILAEQGIIGFYPDLYFSCKKSADCEYHSQN